MPVFFISFFFQRAVNQQQKISLVIFFYIFCKILFGDEIAIKKFFIKLLKNIYCAYKIKFYTSSWFVEWGPLKVLNESKLSLNDLKSDHLGSIWYHSVPSNSSKVPILQTGR